MKFLPNTYTLCLEFGELVPDILSLDQYRKAQASAKIIVAVKGNSNIPALIEYETMPEKMRALVIARYGDPYEYHTQQPIMRLVIHDVGAREFFAKYTLSNGAHLPLELQHRYRRQAEWFNMMLRFFEDRRALKDLLKIDIDTFYKRVLSMHPNDKPLNPKLPLTYDAFRRKFNAYKYNGYESLISKRWGNKNAQKVTPKIENLLLSLYCMPSKPYLSEVCRMYAEFINGTRKVVDMTTGEVFNPQDFHVDGKAYTVCAETVKHYVHKPLNRIIVDEHRMSRLEFDTTHMPHMLRKAPVYAFSKITMDDTSSPFKMHDGTRPACYKIFDVASGALIAMAMHRRNRPDTSLVRAALADMMQQIIISGWKMPHEIEVENAITSAMTGNTNRRGRAGERDREKNGLVPDVLSAGAVFPMVHFCAPENPKEKRAEGFIKQIKYKFQKHRTGFQHRIFARLEANRANKDSESHKERFDYEQIVSFEQEDARLWNESLHPNQKLYPKMTRQQVLEKCQNPMLEMSNLSQVMKYIGYKTATSVRKLRVMVQHNLYKLPNMKTFASLNDKDLEACWLPDKDGTIPQVYLYQDGKFIACAKKEERYQEARIEQTPEDLKILGSQRRYKESLQAELDEKRKMIHKVGVTRVHNKPNYQLQTVPTGRQVPNSIQDEQTELGKYAEWQIPNWNKEHARQSALEEI